MTNCRCRWPRWTASKSRWISGWRGTAGLNQDVWPRHADSIRRNPGLLAHIRAGILDGQRGDGETEATWISTERVNFLKAPTRLRKLRCRLLVDTEERGVFRRGVPGAFVFLAMACGIAALAPPLPCPAAAGRRRSREDQLPGSGAVDGPQTKLRYSPHCKKRPARLGLRYGPGLH